MFALVAGLAAGFFHVLAGPDHLAAVAPLAVGRERTAWRSGFTWGVGHTAGVVLVGGLLLVFRELLPVETLSAWSERLVGAALVAVGAWGFWQARRLQIHRHAAGAPHAHIAAHGHDHRLPSHEHQQQHASPALHGHAASGASFGMGTLHGLAGSSHLFGVLPTLAFASRGDAGLYLAGFGAGAIAAMTVFAALIGAIALASGHAVGTVRRTLLYTSSAAAVVVGGAWLIA
jgi:ABC-type nickel/cobalt efflux system permease component RcnA